MLYARLVLCLFRMGCGMEPKFWRGGVIADPRTPPPQSSSFKFKFLTRSSNSLSLTMMLDCLLSIIVARLADLDARQISIRR